MISNGRIRCVALAAIIAHQGVASAQTATPDSVSAKPRPMVVVTPGAQYRAGWLRRILLGEDYRALWTTPIEVELLDLKTEVGGLTPTRVGGSMQTSSLHFRGNDSLEYVFRGSEKDFTRALPEELRETLIGDLVQDQISGYHPAAALVVARLLDETGIHHASPRLVVMPDDALLGEFRSAFAGVLGTLEVRPRKAFDESTDLISSENLFKRMRESSNNRVEASAFLSARLFDILVGDRDRHREQWLWARFSNEQHALWEPIPRDRDMPFARMEGIGPWLLRRVSPQLVAFGSRYPDMVWLNWNAREIDRRLLAGLERSAWDSATRTLQAQITDAVIDRAIGGMPREFARLSGTRLRDELIQRRSGLTAAADAFYRVLATHVDVRGTDNNDRVEIMRSEDGSVLVSLSSDGAPRDRRPENGQNATYFERRFQPADTREVRVFLHGGADRVVVRGPPGGEILVRIIGGDGDDTVLDSLSAGDRALRVYDSAGQDNFLSEARVAVDRRVYVPPAEPRPQDAVRDWGLWSYTLGGASYSPNIGLVPSVTRTRVAYGFRSHPFASRSTVGLDFSVAERRPRLTYTGEFHTPTPNQSLALTATASGIEIIRFYGFGNASRADQGNSYYRVWQNLFRIAPTWVLQVAPHTTLALGTLAQFTSTRQNAGTLVGTSKPYGSGAFGQVGAKLDLAIDRRNVMNFPTKGYRLAAGGALYPPLWSVASTFGEAHVDASGYVTAKAPLHPTLALRAGARHLWGAIPFHEAAFLGGASTLRGWEEQRFAGRSAVFGSAEVRLRLGQVRLIAPSEIGLLGFLDAGRVMADGHDSNTWHTGAGGGIWIAPLARRHTVSFSVARGRERTGFYARSGFSF